MIPVLLQNCRIFDGVSAEYAEEQSVLVEDGRIREISDKPLKSESALRIDTGGRVLMPGLIDAHFHAMAVDVNISRIDRMPPTLAAQHARALLEQALNRGFTTVRDAAGADYGLKMATEQGLIAGPRLFIAGKAISQTGGHGDMRRRDEVSTCGCGYAGALSVLADGADAVRKRVRETLRAGADQIKIFVSGGVASPTDPLEMTQMTGAEVRAAAEEACRYGTYVMAHSHTPEATRHALDCGVRSIEHGTILDKESAELVTAKCAYVVPTLVTIWALGNEGLQLGLPPESMQKLERLGDQASRSLELLHEAGASIGFGTDLLGELHRHQCREFRLRAEVLPALEILRSATSVNAGLLMQGGRLGVIKPGALADILVLDGDPMQDITLFERHEESLRLIMKGGKVYKNTLDGAA